MLEELGILGLLALIIFIILLPIAITVIVGIALANMLGFAGITWWAFVILFYLVIMAILGAINR